MSDEVTNEQYAQAAATVATRDKQALQDAQTLIVGLNSSMDDMVKKVSDFRDSLPPVVEGVPASSARTQVEGMFNQVQGFKMQMGYLKTSIDGMLTQLNGS